MLDQDHQELCRLGTACITAHEMNVVGTFIKGLAMLYQVRRRENGSRIYSIPVNEPTKTRNTRCSLVARRNSMDWDRRRQ